MIVQGSDFTAATNNTMEIDTVARYANSFPSSDKYAVNNNKEISTDSYYITKEVRRIDADFDPEYDEEADEEFSDEEEFLPEQPPRQQPQQQAALENDVTRQLLNFAEAVNSDIQKFFGRKAEDEESCDIYQDKWTSGKSGRELYYAELLKIAQGGDNWDGDSKRKSDSPGQKNATATKKYSGKMDAKSGVGPLAELFEYGLRDYIQEKNASSSPNQKRAKPGSRGKYESVIPMADRKLPRSFWKQPDGDAPAAKNGILDSSKMIDFTDLIESMNSGDEPRESNINDVSAEFGL